jgi:DNA helicase HerA-like ATPase
MQKQVGVVLDGASPFRFPFKVEKDVAIPIHEYVTVDVGGRNVLAEVIRIGSRNPLVRENIAGPGIDGLEKYGFEVATAEVLGYLDDSGRIVRSKFSPKPNTPVFSSDDEVLQTYYRGDASRMPVYLGSLVNRPNVMVPVFLQDLSFHLGVFAQTRGGKSYLAGALIESILEATHFPVIVIDIHGDYVMMDRLLGSNQKHDMYDVSVYSPSGSMAINDVTAEQKQLSISPKQMTNEALAELLGHLGPLQAIALRDILKKFRDGNKPFGLADVITEIRQRLGPGLPNDVAKRLTSILARLEDVEEEINLPPEGINVQEFLKPKKLSILCLRGLRSRIQDAYTGIIVDLLFRNHVKNFGDPRKAPPAFIFIEEAHRVASGEGGNRYATKALSTVIREGSKFGLYLGLISQRPRNIDQDIMANIGNYAVLRITNAQDQAIIENASESFSHRMINDLPALNQGEAVLVGPFVPLPTIVKISQRKTVHYGVTPNLLERETRIKEEVERERKEKW